MLTQKLGDRLAAEGYRGFLEVDYLVDVDTGELYLGELNPRISGVTSMTNVTAGAYADVPLFLFHLLEYLDVDYEIDVDDINRRWAQAASVDVWSQLILKETGDERRAADRGAEDRASGGSRRRRRIELRPLGQRLAQPPRRVARRSTCACSAPGDYRYPGADLGVLVARSRMQTDDNELTERAHEWIDGIHAQFAGTAVRRQDEPAPAGAMAFKTA